MLTVSIVIQGVPPVTLAEWTLQGDGGKDFYDGEPGSFSFTGTNDR